MNFVLTGKKIVSSQPQKKPTLPAKEKPKQDPKPKDTKPIIRKPSLPAKNQPQPKLQKKKQDIKKEQPKKKQQKIQTKTDLQTRVQEQKQTDINKTEEIKVLDKPPELPKQESKVFQLLVRYNHYKDKFPTSNSVLHYAVIEQKYSFADVFKGNYQPRLQLYRNYGKYIQPLTSGTALQYSWPVEEGKEYEITIAEDEQEEAKYQRKAYIAPKQQKCPCKKNQRVVELTKQMRQMDVNELGSSKHKQLLQQRALQEILYS